MKSRQVAVDEVVARREKSYVWYNNRLWKFMGLAAILVAAAVIWGEKNPAAGDYSSALTKSRQLKAPARAPTSAAAQARAPSPPATVPSPPVRAPSPPVRAPFPPATVPSPPTTIPSGAPTSEVGCGNNKVNLCHLDGGGNEYKTLCVSLNAIPGLLRSNENNYVGKCVHDAFLEEAVILDSEPMEGSEVFDDDGVAYEVVYNATILTTGVVSLGAASEMITGMACYNDTMSISFKETPSPDHLERMFPAFALVVFDGNTLQNMDCQLGLTPASNDNDPDVNSSFLMITGVEAEGKTVTVQGIPASFHHMFEYQDIVYRPVNARRNLRNLALGEFDISESYDGSFQLGKDEKLQINAYAKVNIDASSRGLRLKTYMKWRGFKSKLMVDARYEAGFDLSAYLNASFVAKDSVELLKGDKSTDFLSFGIYGIGLKFPKRLHKWVKKVIPGFKRDYYLGAKADIPAVLKYSLDVDYDVDINAEGSLSTGKKEVAWRMKGPLFGNLESDFDVTGSEPAKSSDIQFDYNYDVDVDVKIKGDLSAGLEPALVLDIVGLAVARVGVFTGFDLKAEYNTDALDPITSDSTFPVLYGDCGVCHYLQAKFQAAARDAFFRTQILGKDPNNIPLFGDWEVAFVIAQLCLLKGEDKNCGDTCCRDSQVCIVDAVSKEGSCRHNGEPTQLPSEAPSISPTTTTDGIPIGHYLFVVEPVGGSANCDGKLKLGDWGYQDKCNGFTPSGNPAYEILVSSKPSKWVKMTFNGHNRSCWRSDRGFYIEGTHSGLEPPPDKCVALRRRRYKWGMCSNRETFRLNVDGYYKDEEGEVHVLDLNVKDNSVC
ncbi:unnamed protein product [Cylindrotheca closterium]|uniref:Uncharacterized protein n=1 Tax=Cylindrotheca closterium TaxID=2856 RepID=A0AAD2GC03_9STRA|nr:unnamed protein product [Cylindrotheca closterium]CAJ1969172.1 unnamed protein product [Cylindrotheca closterium]